VLDGAKRHATAKKTAKHVADDKAEGIKHGIVKDCKYVPISLRILFANKEK
jgi:hypothetical protein